RYPGRAEHRGDRRSLLAVQLGYGGGVGEDHVDLGRAGPGVGERQLDRPAQPRFPAGVRPRVEGGRVPGELPVHAGAAAAGHLGVLDDEDRPALPRYVAPRVRVERQVRAPRVVAVAEPAARELGDPPPRADRPVDRAGHDQPAAPADLPARLGDRVQPAGLVADQYPAGTPHAVPDRDLAGVHRVEPGERLVRADVPAALAPQVLQLALAELEPAGGARGDHAHLVLGQVAWVD